jgi:hypothetical protein
MELKDNLMALLRQTPGSAADAERAREAADLLAAYFRLEQQAARLLDATTGRGEEEPTDLRGKTLADAAELVLVDAGQPLHAKELGARIKARGWTHPRSKAARPEQILFQLAARLPRDPRFRRVAPNTFGLAEWVDGMGPSGERRRPRLGLFSGPGTDVARRLGDTDEHLTGEETHWRSS